MREIKFRRPILKEKEFYRYEYWGVNLSGALFLSPSSDGVYGSDEQFTGLSDKNGKDIYEGDVVTNVKFKDGSDYNNVNLHIYYENAHFGVGMANLSDVKELEVIGSMYENPDLIQ